MRGYLMRPRLHDRSPFLGLVFALGWSLCVSACGGFAGGQEAEWPPKAKEWYDRAQASYRLLDMDDASESIESALKLQPDRTEVRELAAQIALSELDYDATIRHTDKVETAKARGLRARALWYAGRINEAADELDLLLADPKVRDTWAEGTVKLARQARDRKPFNIKGDMVAVMEMPRLQSTAMIVPVELNGQPVLALLATGTPEVVLDSAGNREPAWVTLSFDHRIEVQDVPALTQDLSGLSRDLNAPIKLLLGTHLLRHLNATVDFLGRQFVVRNYEPPPPPEATKVPLSYIRGGGMALSSRLGHDENALPFSFLVDTGSAFTIVLDDTAWGRVNVDPTQSETIPGTGGLRQTSLESVQLGAYDVPNVPAVNGVPFKDLEEKLDMDLDGLIGSGLLGAFRVTWTDGGRALWLEDAATFVGGTPDPRSTQPPPSDDAAPIDPAAPPPAGAPAPAAPPPAAAPPAAAPPVAAPPLPAPAAATP